MKNESYINRTFGKYERTLPRYIPLMFRHVADVAGVSALQTDEHLRLPPDAATLSPIAPGTQWGHEWGNVWLHAEITVPEMADGEILCAIPDV